MAIVLALVCVLIISWTLKLLHVIWWRPTVIEKKLRRQGIYGHPYKLLHGNTKEMIKLAKETESKPVEMPHDFSPRIDPLLHQLAMTYKKEFVIWYGTTPRIVIIDPKLLREVLLNKSGEFCKLETNSFTKLLAAGLITYDGDKWTKHRKIINPAFHIQKIKQMLPVFSVCSEELIESWDKLVGSASSCEVDVSLEFQKLAGDVISRAAFGSSFEEGRLIFFLQMEQAQHLFRSMLSTQFPWLRFLPTKVNKRMRQINREVEALLRGIIEKRKKALQSGNVHKEDLLGLLLKSNLNELQEKKNSNAGMTTEDMMEECRLFYFAGQDTITNLLTWSLIVLSMHTDWQERAREEVLQIIGRNKPTFDDLNHLKIVNMIVLEVLRLYPPLSLVRQTYKETKLGDLYLPAGVQLLLPTHLIHRDPEQWGENALEFNPERFSEGILKASKDQPSYFPFGWGPRICIGQNFAMLEAKLALSQILQCFSFELSPTYTHAPCVALTLHPQHGAQIILHRI